MHRLEERLQYRFQDPALLSQALSHSSYANESRGKVPHSNERLEFLGDSVLGMVTAEFLYRKQPELPEGEMTRLRASLVCEQSLAEVAASLDLGEVLLLGKGEESGGGRERPSILADAVEAVLAAVYLDGGLEAVRTIVHRELLERQTLQGQKRQDYKTVLQELIQRKSGQILSYEMAGESGPDHNKTFRARVLLNGETLGEGEGRSKKEAEQSAARTALEALEKEE